MGAFGGTGGPARSVAALCLVAGVLGLGAPRLAAANPPCGEAIIESVRLDADLVCPGGTGLVVFGNDLTIDLAGHTIQGDTAAGIDNGLGFDRITVRNGTIKGFEAAVVHLGGTGHVIRDLTVRGPTRGIELGPATSFATVRKTVVSNTVGAVIFVAGSDHVFSQVTVVNCGGVGFTISGNRNRITKSTVVNALAGVVAFDKVSGNVVSGNTISASRNECIALFVDGGTDNQVTKNRCEGSAAEGIRLVDADAVLVSANTVVGSGLAGIAVESTSGARILKNVVTGGGGDGIRIAATSVDTLVTGNRTLRNRASGIHLGGPTTRVGKNVADANAAHGIEAPNGAVDAGGNKARLNGSENCPPALTCK